MKNSLTILLIICSCPVFAQTIDTITKVKQQPQPEKFPSRGNFEVRSDQFSASDFAPTVNGVPQGTGRITSHYRFKAAATIPLITNSDWLVNASARYKYEALKFGDYVKNSGAQPLIGLLPKEEFHLFTGALSISRFSVLFGKRMVYNGILSADASNQEFGRVKGNVSATMILKRTKSTSIAVGVAGVIDRSAPIPILPIFSYQHEFGQEWLLDVFAPQRLS
jgi:hypothetical protein